MSPCPFCFISPLLSVLQVEAVSSSRSVSVLLLKLLPSRLVVKNYLVMRSSKRIAALRSKQTSVSSQLPPSSSPVTPVVRRRVKPSKSSSSTRRSSSPSSSDPSSVPLLSRPFVIYGRNNEPYFVQARPLVEGNTSSTLLSIQFLFLSLLTLS